MAGFIALGCAEMPDGTLDLRGLVDSEKIKRDLWNGLNNRQVVSSNLLTNEDVSEVDTTSPSVLLIHVPRASRRQRPVYIGANPLTGTYRRRHDGDYLCDAATVRGMIAESETDDFGNRVLEGYSFDDLDRESISAYRNIFKSAYPDHPWLDQHDKDLLRSLGAWQIDRATGVDGPTFAGLLMFGRLPSILQAIPTYLVDYRDQSSEAPESDQRWADRVTTDGTWSGNLFDFYRRVYRKLVQDIRVPFRLEEGSRRVDETHIHEALREALVNSLIHSDYSGTTGILVVKSPSAFVFRNPGDLRIPLELVFAGGQSDCRNRSLQKMFQLIGAAEQAGSGFPKILRAWRERHWRKPLLREFHQPEQTQLTLSMMSLIPPSTTEELRMVYGTAFDQLSETQRLAMATARIEGQVTNQRLRELSDEGSREVAGHLRELVRRQMLKQDGVGRGTFYKLGAAGEELSRNVLATTPSLFDWSSSSTSAVSGQVVAALPSPARQSAAESGSATRASPTHTEPGSPHLDPSSTHQDAVPHDGDDEWRRLMSIAEPIRSTSSAPKLAVRQMILRLCSGRFLGVDEIAKLMGRGIRTLRAHYMPQLVAERLLLLRYPDRPSHPEQAYTAVSEIQAR